MTIEFQPREVCPRCRRAARVCYCAHLPRLETSTRIVILQHPRERDVPIGTAHMASLCLPNAQLHVGTCVADCPSIASVLADPARPAILLSPSDDAIDVSTNPPRGPVTLVVVDGTWAQAKKIVKHDPILARLPRYAFTPPSPSEYRIRREPAVECVSTIEALMHALGALEGDADRFRALLAPFRAMVDAQLAHAAIGHARLKKPRALRPPKPRGVPMALRERANDWVCVVGEANAWPYSAPEREHFEEELVHWVARRVVTGETFECVLAPKHPLAPGTLRWVELPRERLASGASMSELAERWAEFSRPNDVIVSWGHYASSIFRSAGLPLGGEAPFVDLRDAARSWARGKVGTLEDCLRMIARTTRPSSIEGRAGRRLDQLEAIAQFLLTQG